jgi:excisionase family DNA binding protein
MPEIMTTKELAKYLRLREITIRKHAAEGNIPGIRIGNAWRFDKEAIGKWINEGDKKPHKIKKSKPKAASKAVKVILRKKRKS